MTIVNQLNIHGSVLNRKLLKSKLSGIVIGFDYQVLFDFPELSNFLSPFTKTFRISELNTVLAKSNSQSLKLDYNVNKIVIIGHSLSEADDSYFQTIFDTADLYNSEVILEYWYTDYDGRDSSLSVETENLQIVNSLLVRYIKDVNVTSKNNLLHKLLFENRLILREYNIEEIISS